MTIADLPVLVVDAVVAAGAPPVESAKRPRKPRAKPEHRPVMRADRLASNLTPSKARAIGALFDAWSRCAQALGREQWRLFFETGRFDKYHDQDKVTYKAIIGSAARVQMCRSAVVGQLQGWVSNRANGFRALVVGYEGAQLPDTTKHMLFVINKRQAWFGRTPIVMPDTADALVASQVIPEDVRRLARSMMRAVMARHRWPNLANLSMVLDMRGGALLPPKRATQNGQVAYWARISTMERGRTIEVPILGSSFHTARQGTRTKGVSITRVRVPHQTEGAGSSFGFVVTTDIGAVCAQSRLEYGESVQAVQAQGTHDDGSPYTESIALDFGLTALFGTSEGQLLGQGWGKRLRVLDARIQAISTAVQRRGGRLRDNRRYQAALQDLRGFLATEVGRVLNRLVARRLPKALVVEHLDFRSPTLSRRMNRLVSSCGRKTIAAKLADLTDRFAIIVVEVNPAYTSQTCSCCGYVDQRNRTTQARSRCRWCGKTLHADLNASTNILARRAWPYGGCKRSKASILAGLVRAFGEREVRRLKAPRRSRHTGVPDDPRVANPYFSAKGKTGKAIQGSTVGKDASACPGVETTVIGDASSQ